ncbi:LysR family transcriptional regulator [Streptomyces sp. 6N223]|uniref:LysR family transcriptional regulator n=1 Tax=Streptomyces sp. 6N223 TaxID=3457412 RepID=UPI003FD16DBD
MERREMEILLTLAEELHFGRTAERLLVSQARVSQTIRKLERRIGAPLFERTSRRVALTPIGRRLVEDLRPARERIDAGLARAVAAARGAGGVLRAGFLSPAVGQVLMAAAEAFRAERPGTEVTVRETHLGNLLGPLLADEVDVLAVPLPVREPGLVVGPVVFSEPTVLAVATGHRLARRASVTYRDLAGETVLDAAGLPAYWRDHRCPSHLPCGMPLRREQTFTTCQELLTVVGAGQGIAQFGAQGAAYYARPDVVYVPFPEAPAYDYALVWRAASETERVRAFVAAAVSSLLIAR